MTQKPNLYANQSHEQLQRFEELARLFGCDKDEVAFDEKLKTIARQKPQPSKDPAAPSKS